MLGKIAKVIGDNANVVCVGGQLRINGHVIKKKSFREAISPIIVNYGDKKMVQAVLEMDKDFTNTIYDMLSYKYRKAKVDVQAVEGLKTFNYSNLVPLIDAKTGDDFLFDTEQNCVSEVAYKTVLKAMPKASVKEFEDNRKLVLLQYDPYHAVSKNTTTFCGQEVTRFNLYKVPEWQENYQVTGEEKLPKLVSRFFKHLFPKKSVRKYVYHWVHNAVFKRNETILVLNGAKGTGKGTFENILRDLVGSDNFQLTSSGTFESRFDSVLRNKRVIVFDEAFIDKDAHRRLKLYCNEFLALEAKGVNVERAERTYNSYVVSSNDKRDMYLEVDDRRFSVVEITDTRADEEFTAEELATLQNLAKEPEILRAFGGWLLAKGEDPNRNTFSCWKAESFFRLAYLSLHAWQRYIVDICLTAKSGTSIDLEEVRRMYRRANKGSKIPAGVSAIEDFLGNYRHKGKYQLCTLKYDKEEKMWSLTDMLGDPDSYEDEDL